MIEYTLEYIIKNNIDKKYYGFIYVTTNIINGKKYIGQRKFSKGWKTYLGSGKAFSKSLDFYLKENFVRKIIKLATSNEELNLLEEKYIELFNAVRSDNYYNLSGGGNSSNKYESKTDEEMNIIKEKLKLSKIGTNNPMYGKPGIFSGRHHSEETVNKMRVPKSEKHKQNLRNSVHRGADSYCARSVICITTGMIFDTVKEASEYYCVDRSSITKCCRHNIKSAGKIEGIKLVWEYYK